MFKKAIQDGVGKGLEEAMPNLVETMAQSLASALWEQQELDKLVKAAKRLSIVAEEMREIEWDEDNAEAAHMLDLQQRIIKLLWSLKQMKDRS